MTAKEYGDLEEIFRAGLQRVDPYRMIVDRVRLAGDLLTVEMEDKSFQIDLRDYRRILLLGAGKATAKMALAFEEILGERIGKGLISVKYGHTEQLRHVETIEAGHPLPDDNSLEAARRISALAREADERTLVINLISGGGSALLALPLEYDDGSRRIALTLEEKQQTTRALLGCGANIQEINCIRKHLSAVKGGRLAALIHPARCYNFILSDVVGDHLDAIASGLTAGDATTFAQALEILDRYDLRQAIPENALTLLQLGAAGRIPETPKPGNPALNRSANILIGTNFTSLLAAAQKARELGHTPVVLTSQITGEARDLARFIFALGKDVRRHGLLVKAPACLIIGGETTVTLRGSGKGGRNQEMALAFLAEARQDHTGAAGLYFLSASTDGSDGPTDAAGAFAGLEFLDQAEKAGLSLTDYLKNNDSYHFFDQIGGLLKTGPTNTNVCDLHLLLVMGKE